MSDVKLKPCPFCGGEASINRPSGRMLFCVVCDDCDANSGYYFTEEDAALAWNDRADLIDPTCEMTPQGEGFRCSACDTYHDMSGFEEFPWPRCPECGSRVKGSNSMPLAGEGQ